MFVGLHMMLASATETPEWMLAQEEGDAFMKAGQNVMRHYSVQSTQKTLDWISLFGVVGGIYGTRVAAISIRKRKEKTAKPAPIGENVFAFGTDVHG